MIVTNPDGDHSGLKYLFGFCVCRCKFWQKIAQTWGLDIDGSTCVLFGDLCCYWCCKTESCPHFTGVFALFWTAFLSLSACALAHFFDLSCICFGLDFDACFIFFILFTNTSPSESDPSPCLGDAFCKWCPLQCHLFPMKVVDECQWLFFWSFLG